MAHKKKEKDKILRLILGDQLNEAHCWFVKCDDYITCPMVDIRQETDDAKHYIHIF